MIINIPEADDIYFAKTRDYFQEVLSSYASGYFRSAVVMLYSVAICDILFKLQELRDMYNDTVAVSILTEVEKCRNANDNKSKSKWEKELIDRVYKDTELLDLEAYTNLNHLYDYRNFSAHPALNDNYELVTPSRETTIACIKNTLKDILVKPPVFIKKVVDMLTDDLEGKYEIYKDRYETLSKYLNNKYFSKMSNSMKISTFYSLWKICFICMDEKSKQNRSINRAVLISLFETNPSIFTEAIKNEQEKYTVTNKEIPILFLVGFIAMNTSIYKVLLEDVKLIINNQIKQDKNDSLICWFKYDSYTDYFTYITSLGFIQPETSRFNFMKKHFNKIGETSKFIDYLISNYKLCDNYESSMQTFEISIEPLLSEMNREQYIALIEAVDKNKQNYERWFIKRDNTTIVQYAKNLLEKDFDYTKYSNFEFDESILSDTEKSDESPNEEQDFFD